MNHLTGNSRYAEYARVRVNSEKMFYQARVRKKANSRAWILYLNRFKLIYRHQLRPLGRRKSIAYFCRLPRGGKAYSFASLWKNRRARDLPKKGKTTYHRDYRNWEWKFTILKGKTSMIRYLTVERQQAWLLKSHELNSGSWLKADGLGQILRNRPGLSGKACDIFCI